MNNYRLWQKVLLIVVLCLASCASQQKEKYTFDPSPANNMMHDAAAKMDWLSCIGAVTIAFGVAAFMNGQKAAVSILAAGITLFAGGIITTMALSIFAELKTFALVILIVLGIAGFFVFAGTALDTTGDGKFDWQDVKAVFFKIRRKP